jgi:hypothetical protein
VTEPSRRAHADPACDDARFAASLALDGGLDEIGRIHFLRHLESCPKCAQVVTGMESASSLLRRAPLARFRCELAGGQLTRSSPSGLGRHWAGAAAAVAALVLATGALPRHDDGAAPSPPGARAGAAVVSPLALPIGQRSAMDDFAASSASASRHTS